MLLTHAPHNKIMVISITSFINLYCLPIALQNIKWKTMLSTFYLESPYYVNINLNRMFSHSFRVLGCFWNRDLVLYVILIQTLFPAWTSVALIAFKSFASRRREEHLKSSKRYFLHRIRFGPANRSARSQSFRLEKSWLLTSPNLGPDGQTQLLGGGSWPAPLFLFARITSTTQCASVLSMWIAFCWYG